MLKNTMAKIVENAMLFIPSKINGVASANHNSILKIKATPLP